MQNLWIIGASSGIGLELLKAYLIEGHTVVVSARTATKNAELLALEATYATQLHLFDLDVTHPQKFYEVAAKVWETVSRVDTLIYNAGTYETMALDAWDMKHISAMNETNYMGAVRAIHATRGYFKAQGGGRMVFNASLSSYFGLPFGGAYSAPKAALVNMLESIEGELKKEHIHVHVINHGFVRTRLTHKNTFVMPWLLEPQDAAMRIIQALQQHPAFEIRFPFGLALFLRILRFLPYGLSLRLTQRMV